MGAEQAVHYYDIEFDAELKKLVLNEYKNYEKNLQELHIVKDSYDDAGESLMFEIDSVGERFFYQRREEIRLFLIKNCGYSYNGTGVWLQLPIESDIVNYFQNLISNY